MKILYLTHLHIENSFGQDEKCLGFFTNYEALNNTIAEYSKLAGFSEQPTNFIIERLNIPELEGSDQVFKVSFYIHDEEYTVEFSRSLGVFASREDAERVLEEFEIDNCSLILKTPFIIEKRIDLFILNTANWSDGFESEPIKDY